MIGKTISHYQIIEKLGQGGMGEVYEALDTRLGRKVALKFLPPKLATNREALKRFRREAQAASALNHPNICTIYSIEEQESHPFIAMELLEGDVLRSRIPAGGLPVDEVLTLGIQIADALDASHSLKIVHRDIKTDNIFVTRRGQAKILDFGIAKLESEITSGVDGTGGRTTEDDLTKPGVVLGTIAYMSPEHARGEELDERSDLFSLGAVLYEMATGSRAFQGSTPGVVYSAILSQDPYRPRELRPALSQDLEQIILKLLQKKPGKRYSTAAALRDDLSLLKRQIDSGAFTQSGGYIGIAGDPEVRGRQGWPVGGTYDTLLKQQTSRRSLLRWLAAAILIAFAGVYTFFLTSADYFSYIVIGDFGAGSVDDTPDLVKFVLERGLSQDPDVMVVGMTEFANAAKVNNAERPGRGFRAWMQKWIPDLGRRNPEPLLAVSGAIKDRPGLPLELQLTLKDRGSIETVTYSLRGGNALLSQDMDPIIDRILARFKRSAMMRVPAGAPRNRPISELLTIYWDALKSFRRGTVALEHVGLAMAEREFEAALTIDPSFALAHLQLGKVLAFQRRLKDAQNHLEAARRTPQRITHIDRATIDYLLARVTGRPRDERLYLQNLVALQPYSQQYFYELAESYFNTADVGEAIVNYRKTLALGDYPLAYNHMGACLAWSGDHAAAEAALRHYIELDDSANAYDSLADAYINAGKYQSAMDMKEAALGKDKETYYARRKLVLIDILQGRYRSAETRLKDYLGTARSDSEKARCQAALAFLYYKTQKPEQALQAYELGIQIFGPDSYELPNDELTWIKGLIEIRRGNLSGARNVLNLMRTALDKNGIDATNYKPWYKFYLHLMMCLRAAERNDQEALKAIHDLEFVRDKLGYWATIYDRAFFYDSIGETYASLDRLSEAEDSYREALGYNPHFAPASLHLAQVLQKLGRTDQAESALEAFLSDWKDADPDAPEKITALRLNHDN